MGVVYPVPAEMCLVVNWVMVVGQVWAVVFQVEIDHLSVVVVPLGWVCHCGCGQKGQSPLLEHHPLRSRHEVYINVNWNTTTEQTGTC